uniref:NADH-ubiquinone oxidoreductase chain 2 n=1 Tax=Ergatettix serrifemora TaxID=2740434 RepID=A0A7G7WQZ1_9ORTH|nr:NADH dehydrogenase subunit 2 [Ergatettix serrifemora]
MKKEPTKILFLNILMMSTMISITSNSWLGVWVGLEINLMSFIPLISKKMNYNTSSIKYFITQTMASITLMMAFITLNAELFYDHKETINMMMAASILMKMGAAPLHFWFPEVMEMLNWENCMLMMTWQKLAPMITLSYIEMNNKFITMFIFMSAMIGAIMGLNQISLRMMMTYSSINHMGWMIASLQSSLMMWSWYFIIYSLLTTLLSMMFKSWNMNSINNLFFNKNNHKINKINLMISMMSLGGLPPFLGFLPKWMLIQDLMCKSMHLITFVLIMSSTVTLYFYMKMFLSAGLMSLKEMKWYPINFFSIKENNWALYVNMISSIGLMMSPLMLN